VENAEEYRCLAAQCVHMAAISNDPQRKAAWIQMAGAWLADLAEKNSEPSFDGHSAGRDSTPAVVVSSLRAQ
jgi:hypothetical protein